MNRVTSLIRRPSRSNIWAWYLGVATVLTYLYAAPSSPLLQSGPLFNLLGFSCTAAIGFGIWLHRPQARNAWLFLMAGQFLFFLGDLYTYSYPVLTKTFTAHEAAVPPFPSFGDALYLLVYPALMTGLLLLVRRRNPGGDRTGVIDSTILTVGVALLSWVFIIAPNVHATGLTITAQLVSIAYPVGDILLLAAAIRLAVDLGKKAPAFYLIASSITCLLVTDSVYNYMLLKGTYNHQVILDIGWVYYYLLWGGAALHPSMRTLEEPATDARVKLTSTRLVLLALACMVAPTIRLFQDSSNTDSVVVICASMVMFLLVVARMAGLVRQEETVTRREHALRSAGLSLVGALDLEQIEGAVGDAVRELAGASARATLVRLREDGTPERVGSEGQPIAISRNAAASIAQAFATEAAAGWTALDASRTVLFGADCPTTGVLVVPLTSREGGRACLVAALATQPDTATVGAIQALGAQVSLAIDGAEMSANLHRRRSEARFRSLVAHSSDLITVVDASGVITYQSPSIERVLGLGADDVMQTRFADLVKPSDHPRVSQVIEQVEGGTAGTGVVECMLRSSAGEWRQFEIRHTSLLDDPDVQGIVLNCRDVSERKAFEDQLAHQAFHDPVTNLANRALFADRVQHALARAGREQGTIGVVFIDLDDFKTINDSLGHAAGDAVLQEVSKRLMTTVRPTDTAARFGGDEFAVLIEEVAGTQAAIDVAERILAALQVPIETGGKQITIGASIGLCLSAGGSEGLDGDDLLRNADVAMYMAKREQKGRYRIFEPAMHREAVERLEMRADLQRALETGQLQVHYQPVIRLTGSEVYGFEALLRWNHPTKGSIPPTQFIPVAEDTGLIIPIGRWVLGEACRQAASLHAEFPDLPVRISVNLSVKQLQAESIVDDVRHALAVTGLSPGALVLEITESVMMADTDLAVERLRALKDLGVRLAMDDFGTGYSSLSYLSRFPVDILKMDRSFLTSGQADSALAAAIVALGETLNLEVVAEGIERSDQAASLQELGCELGQGFLFARAMESPAVSIYLREFGDWRQSSEPHAA